MWYVHAMRRETAIATLQAHEAELKQLGVEHLFLFGSTARDDAGEASDIDIFFDHEVGAIGLYELMDIKQRAAEILGSETDMIPRRGLHHVLRERIEASALQVF
jgi:predicted nucleotidyltransferase